MYDRFELFPVYIICHSASGNDYVLKFKDGEFTCECHGFKYRRTCRHIREAESNGMKERLKSNLKARLVDYKQARSNEAKKSKVDENNLFVVCYSDDSTRLIVDSIQLITVLDNARKHHSTIKVFKLGEKVIDWA